MSAQQMIDATFRCPSPGSTTSAVFFLELDSEEAHVASRLASNESTLERVDLIGDNGMPTRSSYGHVVRVHTPAKSQWYWSIGSCPTNDLVLAGACLKHAAIYHLGYDDDDTQQEFATILEKHKDANVQLIDPITAHSSAPPERIHNRRRCLRQLSFLAIGNYKYRVRYPQLTPDEQREQRDLFRSVMHNEAEKQIAQRSLIKLGNIGEGSFGSVTKHLNIETGRLYALKTIDTEKLDYAKKLRRAPREIDALLKARNPHVIRSIALEKSCTDSEITILLPFFPHNLKTALRKNTLWLSAFQIQDIMLQTLLGLSYLHKGGLVHRDIKPDNILLYQKDNGQIIAKVSDLGLAVEYIAGFVSSSDCGALQYCCPRLLKRRESPKFQSDVYSFAVMYVETTFPSQFQEIKSNASRWDVLDGKWAQKICNVVQGRNMRGLEHWITASLRLESNQRPTSSELADAMRALLSQSPVPNVELVMANRAPPAPSPFADLSEAQVVAISEAVLIHENRKQADERLTAPFKQKSQQTKARPAQRPCWDPMEIDDGSDAKNQLLAEYDERCRRKSAQT